MNRIRKIANKFKNILFIYYLIENWKKNYWLDEIKLKYKKL